MEVGHWISLASLALNVISFAAIYYTAARRASVTQTNEHSARIATLEAKIDSLPSKDSFHKLEMDVTEVKGSIRVLETELKPISASLIRIENFLLDKSPPRTRTK